ncbi:ABC transporter substrate-binding protein [Alkalihalophilus marmarensis]|jgi:peptide/nickel transport system substrate-binding protein|uniref:ABC transporter substrate-binding protein n=1 Tax=Alkalihalophilus marmarensis TaxID=521377 RepID=UPI002042050F|nr:ABC transporter substrate-binding protein [Alkalihalophilus marmarensis]MCM3489823.1 ABC transporter substrate-binding protein [Alkalihalophilus marmarensis]
MGVFLKKYGAFLVVLATLLFMTACGGSDSTSGEGEGGGEADTDVEMEANEGNEIVVGVIGDPQSWDPIDTFLLDWSTVGTSIFEGLVDRNLDLELVPGLATEWEYEDDTTLRFVLREGVEFHNGEPFNADAVKFTFDRLLGEEGAQGPQRSNYTAIEEVEIIDEYEVVFHLNQPDPILLTKLAGYGAGIVPPGYIEENGDEHFNANPVGTGPFKMVSYSRDSQIELEKNESYWKEGLPKLDKVTFRFIPEATTRLAELQTGAIDIMKRVEISQVSNVIDNDNLELIEVGSPTVYSLRFNTDMEPLDDVRVRQALNHAIDTQEIIDTILDGYGNRIATYQSDLSFGYNPDLEPVEYDPELAKQLLDEAGVEEGTTLEVYTSGDDSTFREIVQAVGFYLEQVGIQINVNTVEFSALTSDLIPNGQAGHMYRQSWGGWTLDFDNTAYSMYAEGEQWNPSFYDEKVQELLEANRQTVDQEEREAIFMELTERLYELYPEINLYQSVDRYAINNRVQDFQAPYEDRMRLEEVSVQ